ncbi:MAG TPA: DUF1292 domain-containing protein [Candidatus Bariatricus faecipullorum]|nr:DUF1292 domain-containing protein [Candidatus Bariatricus faecipullorum]
MNNGKIIITEEGTGRELELFVVEQTKINGASYLLVADSESEDAQCMILKDVSSQEDADSIFESVEDETELQAVLRVFDELLEDVDIQM